MKVLYVSRALRRVRHAQLFVLTTLAVCLALLHIGNASAQEGPLAQTASGLVRGERQGEVYVFRGMRYAKPPVGKLRFHRAEGPDAWKEVRAALDFAPACPQIVEIDPTENNNSAMDEDCLALNVWTPKVDRKKRPVMVFLHGGAFIDGSTRNTWYDGAALSARGDVVVVTLQYRLGAWGFLELAEIGGKEFAESGNLGILDQLEGLRWVQKNIEKFGGDPGNVTLFGESMGAASINILMTMPAADGLFHSAILESSSAERVGKTLGDATALARAYMKAAGTNTVEELQKPSMVEMREAQGRLFEEWFGDSSFGPTWDGNVLPEPALQILAKGGGANVPLLIGTNLDEIRYWTEIEDLPIAKKPETLLQKQVEAIVGERAGAVIQTYRDGYADYGDAVVHLATDVLFRMPAIRMAEASSHRSPTYMYLFTYRSTSTYRDYGAAHSMELPFVFGGLDAQDVIAVTGRDGVRKQLMEQMQDAWIRFARTGNPNGPGLPEWPKYDMARRATMELGKNSHVVNDPYSAERQSWEGVAFDAIDPSVAQVSAILSRNSKER